MIIEPSIYKSSKNEISIIFSCDNNYIPYLSCCIKSLIEHASHNNYYVLYILENGLSDENKNKLLIMCNKNIQIKFVDVRPYFADIDSKLFYLCHHFSIAVYFRFFIPRIFFNFDKVAYFDCDAVFLDDPAKLFSIEIGDNLLAAVKDTEVIYQINTNPKDTYYSKTLGLKNALNYFNSGVLLLNIKELLKFDFEKKCLEKLFQIKTPRYVDQCIINSVCQDKVYFIDGSWNVENHINIFHKNLRDDVPDNIYNEYKLNLENVKFLHFTSKIKPWNNCTIYNADQFWQYARKTPFYEEIIYKNTIDNIKEQLISQKLTNDLFFYVKNRHKYWYYKILYKITVGSFRKKYKQKYTYYKNRFKSIKQNLQEKAFENN